MKAFATAAFVSLAIGSVTAIIGGKPVPQGTKTFVCNIRPLNSDKAICGCALISPNHVITSASCPGLGPFSVSVGAHFSDGKQEGTLVHVKSVQSHPQYKYPDKRYDVAIMTLETAVSYYPVKLPNLGEVVGTNVWTTAFGWGSPYFAYPDQNQDELQSVELVTWENGNCRNVTQLSYIDETTMCVGGAQGEGVSYGDHGGPLTLTVTKAGVEVDVLVGVVVEALGFLGFGLKGLPSVVLRLSAILDWVTETIKRA